jgi:hypothetical protein
MFYFLWTTNQKVVTLEKEQQKTAVAIDIGEHTVRKRKHDAYKINSEVIT